MAGRVDSAVQKGAVGYFLRSPGSDRMDAVSSGGRKNSGFRVGKGAESGVRAVQGAGWPGTVSSHDFI